MMWQAKARWAQISEYSGRIIRARDSQCFYALLVYLCGAHVEKGGILCKVYEVDVGVDDVLVHP